MGRLMSALIATFLVATCAAAGLSTAADTSAIGHADLAAQLPEGYANPRSPQRAVQWALSQVGVRRDSGYCLRFVNLAYGRPSGPPSAYLVWTRAPASLRHRTGSPPRGALVVWSSAIGGGHGHIGISLGDGRMVSTTSGPISVLPIKGYADTAYFGWLPPYFYM